MSAHPLIENKQLEAKKIKMAMALKGKNTHYRWFEIKRRHFLDTAKIANYSVQRAEQILDEMLEKVDTVIQQISDKLPNKFPSKIYQQVFKGMQMAKNRILKS